MNLHALDLNLLLVFDAIMRERQVSRAGERIGRTQSAVSHSLNKLRVIFKDDLFVRTVGGMEPTPRAVELARPLGAALADIKKVLDSYLYFEPEVSERHFNIGMSDGSALIFLPNLIKSFRAMAPNASINIRNVNATNGYHMLRMGELDYVVLGNVPVVSEHLVAEEILTEKFLCATCNDNPVLNKPLTLDTYLSCDHLHVSLDGESPGMIDIALGERGLKRNITTTIPHYLLAARVIENTDLIVTTGEAPLVAMEDFTKIKLAKPPLNLPDVVFSIIFDKRVETDPGNVWLKSLILKLTGDIQQQKDILYKKNPQLFA